MTIDQSSLGAFGNLSTAIGLTTPTGTNSAWFEQPLGGAGNPSGLSSILSNPVQRDALIAFVDEILGPPAARSDGTRRWIPLFQNPDPTITVYAVVEALAGSVRLGVGLEHSTGSVAPFVATRVLVPLIHVPNGTTDTRPDASEDPAWLLIGHEGGVVEVEVEATFDNGAPVAGDAFLRGAAVRVGIPTAAADDLAFALDLIDLQLPGATTPSTQTLDVDSLDSMGSDVFAFLVGLVRAQVAALDLDDDTFRHIAGLAGILGLREVEHIPALPLAELPARGVSALVAWVQRILDDPEARDAWLAELGRLVGGEADAARDAVTLTLGDVAVTLGLRVTPGASGQPVLVPWAEAAYGTRAGVSVGGGVDLMRIDTATGSISAIPQIRLEVVFGADSAVGAARLMGDGPVEIGSVHVGVRLDDLGRPAFALTLHDVDISAGGTPRLHDLLDLSTPDAALDAVDDVIDEAIRSALEGLGLAGTLLEQLLGIQPPSTIDDISIVDLVADPLGAVRRYYTALLDDADAMAEVLGSLQGLVSGTASAAVAGIGSLERPWRVVFAGAGGGAGLGLAVWRVDRHLLVAISADLSTAVLDDLAVVADLRMVVIDADFAPGGHIALAGNGFLRLLVAPAGADPAVIGLGVAELEFAGAGVEVGWRAGAGLDVQIVGQGLTLVLPEMLGVGPGGSRSSGRTTRIGLPLPSFTAEGTVAWAPDWNDVEIAIGRLLTAAHVPIIDTLVDLVGWNPSLSVRMNASVGARLPLADLMVDPQLAVTTWATDLALDCDHLRTALGVLTGVLSGMSMREPAGLGRVDLPYRSPIAGVLAAPAIIAWTDPPCPPPRQPFTGGAFELLAGLEGPAHGDRDDALPVGAHLLAAIEQAAPVVPGLTDLLFARPGLGEGFDQLIARWTGTDGLTAPSSGMPAEVDVVTMVGYSYAELAALGRSSDEYLAGIAGTAIVHVGCDTGWGSGHPADDVIDATGGPAGTAPPVGSMPAGADGQWFVQLPMPRDAAARRPDADAVAGQAALLSDVLAGRTASIVVVAYGAAGAAALRAAATNAHVSSVITVGTPWSDLWLTTTQAGRGGDALSLLGWLARSDPIVEWPDELLALQGTPFARGFDLVRRTAAVAGSADLPSAGAETLRAGLEVRAVFGVLGGADATAALTAVVGQAIGARSETAAAEIAAAAVRRPDHLHIGFDVPALDVSIGGITVGAGVGVELVHLARAAAPARGSTIEAVREVTVTLQLGVTDGWLLGGPGSSSRDIEVRWVEARVHVPIQLGDQPPGNGFTEFVLHEARAFGASRERWVVRADGLSTLAGDASAATTALPEVKILLGEVVGRVIGAVPDLGSVFETLGLVRGGGLDPDALDRLLFDPGTTLRPLVASGPSTLAAAINALAGAPVDAQRPATAIDLGPDDARMRIDLATRAIAASTTIHLPGMPSISLSVDARPSAATLHASIGSIDPAAGGIALTLDCSTTAGGTATGVVLAVHHRPPAEPTDAGATRVVALMPNADLPGLTDLAARVLPAALIQGLASALRSAASASGRTAFDAGLDALGLLTAAADNGSRSMVLPLGLLTDPRAWLLRRSDPLAASVAVLDALAPLIAPARGTEPGWPIDPAFGITYGIVGGRLELVAHATITETFDGAAIEVAVTGGLAISPTAPPQPIVDARVTVDGWGVQMRVQPALTVELLRPAPSPPLALYPPGAGLGSTIADVGTSLLPPALNALAGRRNDAAASLVKDVGAAIHDLGEAMGLLDGVPADRQFTSALINGFAINPADALIARLPSLASAGLGALVEALDPTGQVVSSGPLSATVRRFAFGQDGAIHLDLDATVGLPAIDLGGSFTLGGDGAASLGVISIDHLRLSPAGVQVDVRIGPVLIDLGTMVLRPIVVVRAGMTSGSFTRSLGIGLGLDDDGDHSVEFRWAMDSSLPVLTAVTRSASGESPDIDTATVAVQLVGIAFSLASGVLAEQLGTVITADATARLQGVVFTGGGRTLDPGLVTDLLDPDRLLARLMTLAWNCASGANPLSITIDGTVTLALASLDAGGGRKRLGLSITLAAGQRFAIAESGDVNVHLEVDASWVEPAVPAGLSVFVVAGTSPADTIVEFAMSVAGIGMRFTKTGGPLLELGAIVLDGLALHLYGEASSSGIGGGARLQLSGLAIAPGGGGSGNAMANSLVNDAGSAGANNRPSFSPSLAIQQHPGAPLSVGLRAGDPPGPWWVVVQRQLGPLYVERIGLDTVEQNGQVTRISLLFTGSVSLFGLNAAVDQLSLNWNGGDVLSISSWSADLMGFAVSADMAGVSLAGGLLKSIDPNGVTSYVGMLVGRFGTYGLSVFGGYASDPAGHASFFVFGGVTGPIGGPPAFFLTGIGGGLGINRGLIIPTDLNEFPTYPFILALDPAAPTPANPMDKLRELNEFFPHSPGNFWFAAGISFNSFALVDGVAVVAVAFGDGLEINLLGLARMALPRPGAALVSIELALLARFSTIEGVFMIKAQLTDNSWVLYEDIRLTGGFAFAVWWKGPLAGQFVLTMGGYHPDFRRDGYPDVPRLGLVWQISDAIEMKGESYFALTSEALMAGTSVSVSVDFGWVWAKITFGADGIVYFDPFFFDVSAYCRISAGIDIDLGFFSVSMSISIGARIHVWGPEFAGEVVFEIGPCEVPISFGPQSESPGRTLDWPSFVEKYLEDAGGGTARALSGITGRGTLPTSTKGQQSAPSADGSAALPFAVFAEFDISFTTTIPTTSFDVGGTIKPVPSTLSNGAGTVLGLAPMGAGDLTSSIVIALKRRNERTGAWEPEPDLSKLAGNLVSGAPIPDGSRVTTDAYPTGVWGEPKSLTTSVKPVPSGDVVITGNRVILVAGVDTKTVGPEIDYYQVEAGRRPLPLRAVGTLRVDLMDAASAVSVASPVSTAEALRVAKSTLFTQHAGVTATEFSRASYEFDRVAPPRFGNLADGLAVVNGQSGQRAPAPTAAVDPPKVRPPFVVGYLASGVGAARRPWATTVADQRVKRRPAPTTDSVRGRMGRHLPASLKQAPPPASEVGGTVVSALSVPRTDLQAAVRTIATGPVGRIGLNDVVGGLGGVAPLAPRRSVRGGRGRTPRDGTATSSIATGDVVALQLQDSRIDTAPERPSIQIAGRARVVLLAPHGVVFDDDAVDRSVIVPIGTSLIAIQADGDADALDGFSGWHDRSRVALIASRAAIGAGCTVVIDGRPAGPVPGWASAGLLTLQAAEIATRFSRPMRTIAVALTGVTPRSLDRTQIHLLGARVTRDRDGTERPPAVVTLGQTTVMVYDIVPDRGATSVTVAITTGAEWAVVGVLGGGGPNEPAVSSLDMAERIARRGLVEVTAQLTVMQGPGCRAEWVGVAGIDRPRPTRAAPRRGRNPR